MHVFTDGDDEAQLSHGVYDAYTQRWGAFRVPMPRRAVEPATGSYRCTRQLFSKSSTLQELEVFSDGPGNDVCREEHEATLLFTDCDKMEQ